MSRAKRQGIRGVSLRLRLALLSTALLGLTLLIFGLVVYVFLDETLRWEVDSSLRDRAQVIAGAISVRETSAGIAVSPPDVDAIATNGAVAQAVLLGGDIVRSGALGSRTLPISDEAIAAARGRQWLFETVEVPGATLRIYNMPLIFEGQPIGILQVARPIRETEAVLAIVRLILVGGASFSIVVSILLSLLVARTALRPIDLLTRDAERIGKAQDFAARVSARSATRTDEVGRLAATFNGMLDRLQEAFGALTRANEKLEAGLTSQRRFVADASHELRTPLTTVRGNASLLRRFERLTPEDRAAAVEQIAAESERMSRLVNDLLTLARADAGQRLDREPVALGPLIDDVALQGRVLADSKVAVSVVRLTDAQVRGDADALRQLLLILVDNAVKYTPRGGSVTIGLSTDSQGASREQGATARISVVDTGVGIPAADLPHVFERFYRADRARQAGGTGLGLSIGKWIAESHGGTISVDSAPGTGSIFTITLPAIIVTPLPPAAVVRHQVSAAPFDSTPTTIQVPSPTP